jgi:hypothetical protein
MGTPVPESDLPTHLKSGGGTKFVIPDENIFPPPKEKPDSAKPLTMQDFKAAQNRGLGYTGRAAGALAYGLGTGGSFGIPGDIASFIGLDGALPTTGDIHAEVKKRFGYAPQEEKDVAGFEQAGELLPAVGAGGKLAIEGTKAAIKGVPKLTASAIRKFKDLSGATKLASAEEGAGKLVAGAKQKAAAEITKHGTAAQQAGKAEQDITAAQRSIASEAASSQAREVEAQKALDQLNAKHAALPQSNDEQFAAGLKTALATYVKKFTKAREDASGFGQMLRTAGKTPRISTKSVVKQIENIQKTKKSPQIIGALERIKSMLSESETIPGEERVKEGARYVMKPAAGKTVSAPAKLSVEQAHDAKMEIDNMISSASIRTETGAAVPLDKATVRFLRQIKSNLTSSIARQYPAYGKALTEFAKASRPLDVVERNANIRKLTSLDPYSDESKVLASDFVGRLLGQSNKGSKILSRLVQESPELKNSARTYFARQLFERGPPTEAVFRNFLFRNQGKLVESGLLEEFSSMKRAKKAAEDAVKTAKDVSPARIESILKTAESPEQFAARARESVTPPTLSSASTRLKTMLSGATAEKEAAQGIINQYRTLSDKIDTMPAKDAVGEISRFYDNLSKNGLITSDEYRTARHVISEIEKQYGESAEARNRIKKALLYAGGAVGAATVGTGAVHMARSMTGL